MPCGWPFGFCFVFAPYSCPALPRPTSLSLFGLRHSRLQHLSDVMSGAPLMQRFLPASLLRAPLLPGTFWSRLHNGPANPIIRESFGGEVRRSVTRSLIDSHWRFWDGLETFQPWTSGLSTTSLQGTRCGAGLILKSHLALFVAPRPCQSCLLGKGAIEEPTVTCPCFWNRPQLCSGGL